MKTSRRKFIENSFKTTVIITGSPILATAALRQPSQVNTALVENPLALQFSQIALPYAYDALEPSIDATTMDIHYNKHHTSYIKNVNDAIAAEKITFSNEKAKTY